MFVLQIWDMGQCPPVLLGNMRQKGCKDRKACGQFLSIRHDPLTDRILALDTFKGIYSVNVHNTSEEPHLIFDVRTKVNGRAPVHLNDFIVTMDRIIMTDSRFPLFLAILMHCLKV